MLVLVGASCVGKTTMLNELVNKYGYKRIVTYTTRPMRNGEVDGVDYHFIDNKTFNSMCAGDYFAETTSYQVATGDTWCYGTALKDVTDDAIIILNPEGLRALKNDKTLNITAFYLFASYGEIWNRLRERGDDSEEAARRIEADKKDFEDINDYVDFAIRTDGECSIDEIASIINQIYSKKE